MALLRSYRRAAVELGRAQAQGRAEPGGRARLLELRSRFTASRVRRSLPSALRGALASFPGHVYELRWHILVAAGLFWLAAGFGWVAVTLDPWAASWLLPASVHEGILARLADGQHWLEEVDVSAAPALSGSLLAHNVEAAVEAVALGILAGLGAVAAMVENGAFLGAVAGLVHARGMDRVLWAFVAPHGVLEFPAVWLAGAAGLALGEALVIPGPGGRGAALRRAASHAGPVAVALVPLLGLAALVEGFFSPVPKPDWASFGFAALLGASLLAYLGSAWWAPSRRPPASTTRAPAELQSRAARRRSWSRASAAQ